MFLSFAEGLGAEFFTAKDFHIVEKSNHGVIFEIELRDMFKNSLGKLSEWR